jgi:hypothetical protein
MHSKNTEQMRKALGDTLALFGSLSEALAMSFD